MTSKFESFLPILLNFLKILVYADMNDDECNSLDFMLHTSGIDATIPTRQWSIKVFDILNPDTLDECVPCNPGILMFKTLFL